MSPSKKIRKIDEAGTKRTPDRIIRFEVAKVAKVSKLKVWSEEHGIEVKGVPWKVQVLKENILVVKLHCNPYQSTLWKVEMNAEFILVHSDSNKNVTSEKSFTFELINPWYGGHLMEWNECINEGFVKDDKITIEVRFWIRSMMGVRSVPLMDFNDPDEPSHDIALMIDGERIYVSKSILAVNSPVFKAMFYGDFSEKNKKEVQLKDVDRQEFIEMLNVIYPSFKAVDARSAEFLLKLGDRFEITRVIDRVEEYLMKYGGGISQMNKLRMADQYNLFGLKEHCISKLRTIKHFETLEKSRIYNGLSDATKDQIREKKLKEAQRSEEDLFSSDLSDSE